jgi:hypothetical protein
VRPGVVGDDARLGSRVQLELWVQLAVSGPSPSLIRHGWRVPLPFLWRCDLWNLCCSGACLEVSMSLMHPRARCDSGALLATRCGIARPRLGRAARQQVARYGRVCGGFRALAPGVFAHVTTRPRGKCPRRVNFFGDLAPCSQGDWPLAPLCSGCGALQTICVALGPQVQWQGFCLNPMGVRAHKLPV